MKRLLFAMFLVFVLTSAAVAGKYVQKENKLFRIIDSLNHETAEMKSEECFTGSGKSCKNNKDCENCEGYAECQKDKCVEAKFKIVPIPEGEQAASQS